MKVLLIAPTLEIIGGQSVQADRLRQGFCNDGAALGVELEFLPINPKLPGPLRWMQRIKIVRTFATVGYFLIKAIPAVWRNQVVHSFCAGPPSFFLHPTPAILLAKVFGRRSILHFHDGRAGEQLRRWPMLKTMLTMADRVVTPSGYLADLFGGHGIPASAIPNTIDTHEFRYRSRAGPAPVFLHNRGLEQLYNVACMLRAFAIVQKRYPEASLKIAHDGPLRAGLESLARELGLRQVEFVGGVSMTESAALYDWAEIYWMCPNIDNMPLSVLECYAAGLPLISTKAGGVPYIVEDGVTGLLVDLDSPQGLAAAAFRLLEEPGLAQRLAEAGLKECGKYRWAAVGKAWSDLYRELAGPRG